MTVRPFRLQLPASPPRRPDRVTRDALLARIPIELECDERGAGHPVILIMGIGTQLIHWPDAFCDGLAAQGLRVIRFDNRDVGKSTWLSAFGKPEIRSMIVRSALGLGTTAPYLLSDMAGDVIGLMDGLGLKTAHLVGISMGGMIAQTAAIEHGARIASITSMNSTTGEKRYVGQPRALAALFSGRPTGRADVGDYVMKIMTTLSGPLYPPDEAEVRARAVEAWDRGTNPSGFLRQMAAIIASEQRRTLLSSVRSPALVLHGADDPLIPLAAGRATAAAIPGARLHVIDGLGHVFPRSADRELITAIAGHVHEAARRA
ncbi:MAG: alpha/beta fold hydrolase [Myxococcales bacterium]|nr:alpha/beta fold hydrolase [Myxococcales bacterium]